MSDEAITSLVYLDTLTPTLSSPHFTSGSQSLTQQLVVPPHIDSSQNNNHKELVKISSSLYAKIRSYAFTTQLKLSDKHITHLQEELTYAQRHIDKLEVKVQDQLKASNEREHETMEQVKKLQAALAAAQHDQQQANAAQKDLVNSFQYAKQLLEKAKNDVKDKNAEISALEDQYNAEI
ncbi:hypothetical protein QQF64_009622 [Cirrhinus molitorella]|uniref:Uncharacterized protein n=1 Tax=Cirrhinus molitorella TaxID=172907 RepID=A0ABR3M369_9TELE